MTAELQKESDLCQKDLAAYLRYSQVCYSQYELGKRDIPTDVLIRLARFYRVSVDYLLGLTDKKGPILRRSPPLDTSENPC